MEDKAEERGEQEQEEEEESTSKTGATSKECLEALKIVLPVKEVQRRGAQEHPKSGKSVCAGCYKLWQGAETYH